MTVRSEILLNPDHQITGIRHAWTFDELYTAMAMQGVDTNGDGILSKEELKPVVESMVNSLKPFDYFTYVHFAGVDKVLPLKPPERYSLDYDGNALTLHFTLFWKSRSMRAAKMSRWTYTTILLCAFGFANDEPVKMAGISAQSCGVDIKQPDPAAEESTKALSGDFFRQLGPNSNFGAQFAQTVTVKCSDAPS